DRSCWACFPCASHHPCAPFARTAGPPRLSWETRLARNVRRAESGQVTMNLFGVSPTFAALLGPIGA
ncbi:MAG TPA: hypothetical protein VH593_12825, partial [Ktedonobacteraceae bacterium]